MGLRIFLFLLLIPLNGCGIKGNPIPPSAEIQQKKISFFGDEEYQQESPSNTFTSDARLNQIGGDYNGDITDITQQLPDLFELLKPESAQPKEVSSEIPLK